MRSVTHLGGGGDSDGDPCAIVYVADLVEQRNKKHGFGSLGRLLSALAVASCGARVNELGEPRSVRMILHLMPLNSIRISNEIILA